MISTGKVGFFVDKRPFYCIITLKNSIRLAGAINPPKNKHNLMKWRPLANAIRQAPAPCGILLCLCLFSGCTSATQIEEFFIRQSPSFEEHFALTEDGWQLSLFRYKPASIDESKAPVILCHGLSYNNLFWDIDEKHSLARYLARNGYDTWSLSLRGCRRSTKSGFALIRNVIPVTANIEDLPRYILQTSFDFSRINWTIDDHAKYDVAAAIDYVRKKSGSAKVNWVGHSMGGMLMYAYLPGDNHQQEINSIVMAASPLTFPEPVNDILELFKHNPDVIKLTNLAVARKFSSFVKGVAGARVETPLDMLFYNRKNMEREVIQKIFFKATEDIAPGVMNQLLDSVRIGGFVSSGGKKSYVADVKRIQVPAFFLVGTLDNLASPEGVRYAFRNVSSSDRKFRLFGTVNGYKADYGHNDLILGRYAFQEVFPLILSWLNSHPLKNDIKE